MVVSPLYLIVMGTALTLLCLVAPPLLAVRKGYAWYLWTIACGPLGLIVIAFLPFAYRSDVNSAVNQSRRQTGNIIGAGLSVIALLGILLLIGGVLILAGSSNASNVSVNMFSQFLISLATQLPLFIVYLVGFILALIWFRQCPKASVFAILGIGVLLLNSVLMTVPLQFWLPQFWLDGRSSAEFQWIFMVKAIIDSLIGATGSLLLIFAVFSGRSGVAGHQRPKE